MPESFWDAEKKSAKGEDFKKHLAQLETFKTEIEAARGTLPDKAEGYKLELPDDVKLPDGYEPDEKEPKFVGLRQIALEDGLSQKTVNKIVKLDAVALAAYHDKAKQQRAALDAALGENGAARVTALSEFIDSHWSKPEEARQMRDTMWTPVIVKHLETYQKMLSSQGVHSFSQAGRGHDAPDGKPEGFETWKPIDQLQWNRQQKTASARH